MDLRMAGKVAIVTGASRGIGEAIARRLAEEGMDLVLTARDETRLLVVAKAVAAAGRRAIVVPADLSLPDSPALLVQRAIQEFGRIDVLVNNAGATKRGDFLQLSEQDWTDGFSLKFHAAVRLSRAAWASLKSHAGCIVNIAGVGGRTGSAEFAIGGAVNAAMLNLTKCLADRGVIDGVRVNAVNPGLIGTDRLAVRVDRVARDRGVDPQTAASLISAEAKISRFGDPSEVADAVAFLAGAQAKYIQGAILDVDGGLTRTL